MKTSELTGVALDWAVAKCEALMQGQIAIDGVNHGFYRPSTSWTQGGPIIEREWVDLHCVNDSLWEAECPAPGGLAMQHGPTPLVAAMRCYVVSKLGDEVDLPDGLDANGGAE